MEVVDPGGHSFRFRGAGDCQRGDTPTVDLPTQGRPDVAGFGRDAVRPEDPRFGRVLIQTLLGGAHGGNPESRPREELTLKSSRVNGESALRIDQLSGIVLGAVTLGFIDLSAAASAQ